MDSHLHLQHSDGTWKYTNKLIHSTSPYLLQHAHNPVDWYPWGEEALQRAKAEDKPILVSIGYATCYWCHVMERQIFCDPAMAELMNRYFINIKIDREERPDLDMLYMAARQLMTREGGWPNNVVLTPECKPFFAGGTFAVDRRYGKPGFGEVVFSLADAWNNRREMVLASAEEVTRYLEAQLLTEKRDYATDTGADRLLPRSLFEQLLHYADKTNGGFFHSPKFPQEAYLLFLLGYERDTKTQEALDIVTSALDAMVAGGLYDHVGGGFHRYAVDEEWKVPHFEKMLYNQAWLARCYSEAYRLTEDPYYRFVAESTLDFVLSTLQGEEGQYYSALDAETDEIEGEYYVWNALSLGRVLSHEEEHCLHRCFRLAEIPHFEGHKQPSGGVLYVHDLAKRQEYQAQLLPILMKLKKERALRPLPLIDAKVITSWHSMIIAALVEAAQAFGREDYRQAAERGADYVITRLLQPDGRLLRVATRGETPPLYGFLEDYSYCLQAFLSLYEAGEKSYWRVQALQLAEKTLELFEDSEEGGFFFTEQGQETLVRIKEGDDSAFPSANAVMLHNMVKLLAITGDSFWYGRAEALIAAFHADIQRSPISYTHMISGIVQLTPFHKHYGASHASGRVRASIVSQPEKVEVGIPFSIALKLVVDEGWHIYAAQEQHGHLTPTHIAFSSEAAVKVQHIHYPAGQLYQPVLSAEKHYVYQGEVLIEAELVLEAPLLLAEQVEITTLIEWQPCNHESCLALERKRLEVVVRV